MVPDSFVYTDYDGTLLNERQFLQDLKDPDYVASLVANDDLKVYLYDGMAIVTGRYHSKGTYKHKPFDHVGRFTDTWLFYDSRWQCVASHTNLINK